MSNSLDLGVHGIEVSLGDHVCGVYAGERERDDLLIPVLEAGLRCGDKCICVIDGTEPAEVVAALGPHLDASERAIGKQLDVIRASDMYPRSGRFSVAEVIDSWEAALAELIDDGRFDAVRVVATWSVRDVMPNRRDLLVLEAEMNRHLTRYPAVIVNLYDLDRFGAGILVDLVKTHPRLALARTIVENPYYMHPGEVLAVTDVTRPAPSNPTSRWPNSAAPWEDDDLPSRPVSLRARQLTS